MKLFFVLSLVITFLTSCAIEKPEGKTEAEVLFKEAQNLKEDSRFILATEKLNRLKNEHPYSFYAVPAELMLADILYEQENFVEAAAAYIIFKDFHPKHQKIPYVTFRIAESFYQQIPSTSDRDLQSALEAIKYYKQILTDYPNSEHVKAAAEKIKEAQGMLIEKERYIADFYFKTENFDAAMWRYKYILENIKDIDTVRYAMLRLIESSSLAKKPKECVYYAKNFVPLFKEERKAKGELLLETCQDALGKEAKSE